jgi:dynein heavy chain
VSSISREDFRGLNEAIKNEVFNIKVMLTLTPLGENLRSWARKYPTVFNCSRLQWFHPWPSESLANIARGFLPEFASLGQAAAGIHEATVAASKWLFQSERRLNYTTPKSYFLMLSLWKELIEERRLTEAQLMSRYQQGLEVLASTEEVVEDLSITLKEKKDIVERQRQEAEVLIGKIKQENEDIARIKETALATEERNKSISRECEKLMEETENHYRRS